MATPIVGDHAVAVAEEEQHLVVPVVTGQRPSVTEDDRLALAPVLVEDLKAVGCDDRVHLRRLRGSGLTRTTIPPRAGVRAREYPGPHPGCVTPHHRHSCVLSRRRPSKPTPPNGSPPAPTRAQERPNRPDHARSKNRGEGRFIRQPHGRGAARAGVLRVSATPHQRWWARFGAGDSASDGPWPTRCRRVLRS